MSRIVIFGNSGSGKSTLAKRYCASLNLMHLDLDSIAWEPSGERRELSQSIAALKSFIDVHHNWVVEGCYGTLIKVAAEECSELIFLNLSCSECQKNCRQRPWEPHKYDSFEKQQSDLEMLLYWVADYYRRHDEYSLIAHQAIFDAHRGEKHEINSNFEAKNKAE